MNIFAPLVAGIVLVCTLVHRTIHNLVFKKSTMPIEKSKQLTTYTLVAVSFFVPLVPLILLVMGCSVGLVSIMTLGAIAPGKQVIVRRPEYTVKED